VTLQSAPRLAIVIHLADSPTGRVDPVYLYVVPVQLPAEPYPYLLRASSGDRSYQFQARGAYQITITVDDIR
jgi:hypothetical protein